MKTTHRIASLVPGRIRRRWRDAPVRRKLLAVVVVCTLLFIPAAGLAMGLQLRASEVRAATRSTERSIDEVDSLQDALLEADTALRYYAVLGFDDQEYMEHYRAVAATIDDKLAAAESDMPDALAGPAERMTAAVEAQAADLEGVANYDTTTPSSDDTTAPSGTDEAVINERPPNLLELLIQFTDTMDQARLATEDVETGLQQRLTSQRNDLDRLQDLLAWSVLGSWVVGLTAIMSGIGVVTTGIVRRLERVAANGQRFLLGKPLLPVQHSSDEIGRLADGMTIVHELLDQRRRAAVEANLAKDEFLTRISHELRTPLTAVIGYGQILEEQSSPDDQECAHHVVRGGQHLLGLINDLLDISKIEIGHLTISVEPISVQEVVDDTVALVRSLAASREITITTECPGDPMVNADRQRLRQILLNLLSNAIKYNRHAGHVNLAVAPNSEVTRISVTDTGAGIPPEGLARLFQPFERLDAANTDVEGSGIGLALTKRLVEAIGGTIGVESQVGKGTTFWVELTTTLGTSAESPATPTTAAAPAAAAALAADGPQPDGPAADSPPAGSPVDQPVVLYVDDSRVNLTSMQRLFDDRPERLEIATEGRHTLELARQFRPRLILLDLNLPDINGDEVLRMLKADPATAGIPVVIVTAEATPGRADQMLAHGASAFLPKPIDTVRLTKILDAIPAPV